MATPGPDGLPESNNYTDTGCNISPSCLRCPLKRCKYDAPDLTLVNTEISALYKSGWSVDLLCEKYGMTERTVYRRIAIHASGADQLSNNHRRLQDKPGISLEALAKRSSYKAPGALGVRLIP